MRGVGDELPSRVIERREPLAHAVERPRELPDLVAALVVDRLVEPPRSDSLSRTLQPPQSPGEQERAEIAEAERDGERNGAGDQQPLADEPHRRDRLVQRRRTSRTLSVPGTGEAASA